MAESIRIFLMELLMRRTFLYACILLMLGGTSVLAGGEIGTIDNTNSGAANITVKIRPGVNLMMGDMLEADGVEGKIRLEVTFPMQTIVKCRIKGKGKISEIKKGMPVYREGESGSGRTAPGGRSGRIRGAASGGSIDMVKLQGGNCIIGSPSGEDGRSLDEEARRVNLSPFWISRYEITQKQYAEVMGTNPSRFKGENLPVENIIWYDAIEFCNRLSEKHNLKPYYKIDRNSRYETGDPSPADTLRYMVTILGGDGYRLPTEAEWEYACRGGTATPFSSGNGMESGSANFNGNYPYNSASGVYREMTTAVGSFRPNQFGIFDMHGNVAEWCFDYYGRYSGSVDNPVAEKGAYYRISRGGSWSSSGVELRSASRGKGVASYASPSTGLRVARSETL